MAMITTGNYHNDARKIRNHGYFEETLDDIRRLRSRFEKIDKKDIGAELDAIFKILDDKLS